MLLQRSSLTSPGLRNCTSASLARGLEGKPGYVSEGTVHQVSRHPGGGPAEKAELSSAQKPACIRTWASVVTVWG